MPDEKEQPQPIELEIEEYAEEVYEEEEEEEDEYYSDDTPEEDEYAEERVAYETWDLPNDLSLPREAATFYLLLDLHLDDLDQGHFDSHVKRLATLFGSYSDMVVGGELRYALNQVDNIDFRVHSTLVEELRRSRFNRHSRCEAWEEWYNIRAKHGIDALRWAEEAFRAFGRPATYGGDKWAYIAETLRKYESGEYSPLLFVDMCWGLEHNGGQFFGKLWQTYSLKPVLDANQREDMDTLLDHTNKITREFYVGVRG
jgi:hypothetical protein